MCAGKIIIKSFHTREYWKQEGILQHSTRLNFYFFYFSIEILLRSSKKTYKKVMLNIKRHKRFNWFNWSIFIRCIQNLLDIWVRFGGSPWCSVLARVDSKTAVLLPHKMFKLPLMILAAHWPLIGHLEKIQPSHWSIRAALRRQNCSLGDLFVFCFVYTFWKVQLFVIINLLFRNTH